MSVILSKESPLLLGEGLGYRLVIETPFRSYPGSSAPLLDQGYPTRGKVSMKGGGRGKFLQERRKISLSTGGGKSIGKERSQACTPTPRIPME